MDSKSPRKTAITPRHALSIVFIVLLLASGASAQTEGSTRTDSSTPLGLSPGSPAGSYPLADFETVNLFNGSLNFRLPLLNIGGRGGTGYSLPIHIEQKWSINRQVNPHMPASYSAHSGWWSEDLDIVRILNVGRLQVRRGGSENFVNCGGALYTKTVTRITFTAPDGTEYELRDQLTGGQPATPTTSPCQTTRFNRQRVFVTADGTSATYISDNDILDALHFGEEGEDPERDSGEMMLRDGTHFHIVDGSVRWMRDRNGNMVTFDYDAGFKRLIGITDSLNRHVTIVYGQSSGGSTYYDEIRFTGFGGAPRAIRIGHCPRSEAMRSDISMPGSLFSGATVENNNPLVINYIELPDGRRYQVQYNAYAEIARVILPTGGAIEYDWANGLTDGAASGQFDSVPARDKYVYRRVIERRVYPNGGTGSAYESKMTYSRPESMTTNAGYVEVNQYDSSGVLLGRSRHYFYGSARASFLQKGTDYPAWQDSREYSTEIFDTNGTTLRRVENIFAQRTPVSWWTLDSSLAPPNDVRVTDTITTLADTNQVSKQSFGYDDSVPFNNQNSVKEYDYGSGAPGLLVRETRTTFVTDVSYTGMSVHLRNLPAQVSIYDGATPNRLRAQTVFEYDNYGTADNFHTFIKTYPPVGAGQSPSGFEPSFNSTSANLLRGNVTKTSRNLLDASGAVIGSISSYAQYDVLGNVVKAIDPRSTPTNLIATTFDYADNFGTPDGEARTNSGASELNPIGLVTYAVPTVVTNALGHKTYTQYDYYLGKPVNVEDANGIVFSGSYDDALDRPKLVQRAIGTTAESQTAFSYNDTDRVITTTSDLDTDGRKLISKLLYDRMGRTIETQRYEGGGNYIAVQMEYDVLGRASKTSNPFRPWQSETAIWTTNAFDALGRVISVTTPDNAVVSTSYLGNAVTVTDQALKTRKSVTDGLGRLTSVYESPSDSNYNYLTSYAYDTLDNLIAVTQGSQTRTFVYDSLKRLKSATNPESGTICYGTVVGGQCLADGYDANGNLVYKTDARGVRSTYTYDALNRNTLVDYSDTSVNPDITRVYDNATSGAKGIGRLWHSYAGGTNTTGTNVEETTVDSYHPLGSPLVQRQLFKTGGTWSAAYQTQRTYNLAGHVKTQTYPSGNAVTYNYDAAGRLANKDALNPAFSGNLGDGAPRTYASDITYASLGGLAKEKFGTDTAIYNKLFYNSRGQLAEIRETTSDTGPSDTTWNRGKFINWYSLTCGGPTCNATNNNGNLRKQETWIPNNEQNTSSTKWYQQYEYDALNRLTEARERATSNDALLWSQIYTYDRHGNRTINAGGTSGGVNNQSFEVETATNRLLAPGDSVLTGSNLPQRKMRYDAAGNLTNDSWSSFGSLTPGAITRLYDAENRMTSALDNSGGISSYIYNADGQRVRRKTGTAETWQVYGMDGELLAEYAANTSYTTPQKEYGYRNGQLLIVAEAGSGSIAPIFGDDYNDNSLDANKWTVNSPGGSPAVTEQSQRLQITLAPNTAGYNGIDSVSTYNLTGRMVQVEVSQAVSQAGWAENYLSLDFDANNSFLIDVGTQIIFRSRVNGVNDQTVLGYSPTVHRHWRIRHDPGTNTINFETSTDGSVWTTRKTVTPGFALTNLRFRMGAGAWGTGNSSPGAAKYDNFKLLASAQASSSLSVTNFGFEAPVIGNSSFQYAPTGGAWTFTAGAGVTGNNSGFTGGLAAPQGSQAAFIQAGSASTISQLVSGFQSGTNYIITFASVQRSNCCNSGGQDFQVYLDSILLGTFHPSTGGYADYSTPTFTTTAGTHVLKFVGLNSLGGDHTAFIDNVRIQGSPALGFGIEWLVTDQLGTPRMVFDKSGLLANVRRHDYLPFGEELTATQGLRSTTPGYNAPDGVRQKFTQKERDSETGLDFFESRYYAATQGRFTSSDPLLSSGTVDDPQTWNRYSYGLNNPLQFTDPLGLYVFDNGVTEEQKKQFNAGLQQAKENLKKIGAAYGTTSKEYKKAERALNAYGGEGVKNGVTIVAKDGAGGGRTGVVGVAGQKTADNPAGQNIRVQFDPSAFEGATFGNLIGHEGSHAADGSDWVKSGFRDSANPTTYQGEVDAYTVQSLLAQARNPDTYSFISLPGGFKQPGKNPYLHENVRIWDSGWNEADRATLRRTNIDKVISRPKNAGGLYGLTPTSKDKAFEKGSQF
jgi:RHS repeat-associated protein